MPDKEAIDRCCQALQNLIETVRGLTEEINRLSSALTGIKASDFAQDIKSKIQDDARERRPRSHFGLALKRFFHDLKLKILERKLFHRSSWQLLARDRMKQSRF